MNNNWFNILKNQGLVNLPKFKIKPFDKPKPDEEDTQCKDKIMEIADFIKKYQFPSEIGDEYVRVKEVRHATNINMKIEDSKYSTMHYGGKKSRTKMWIDRYFTLSNIDNIPEEVFCAALDLLKAGGGKTNLMDYQIMVELLDNQEIYTQKLFIAKQKSLDILNMRMSIIWHDWFGNDGVFMSSEDERNVAQALRQEADNMRWPI